MLPARSLLLFAGLSVIFAAFGRLVRGVTPGGAIAGAVVCFVLLLGAGVSGFAVLLTVFVVTWVSTRFGYLKKQRLGTAEPRAGRNECQVLANLGISAGCASLFVLTHSERWLVAMGAALAEAAGDTVSSEIGQAVGSQPRLISNWNRVPAGTDGAVTLAGSIAGVLAATAVAAVSCGTRIFGLRSALVCAVAGITGMIADSVLGATAERRELMGNNGVNFISTAIAAIIAFSFDAP
jgi:uncharacterized protein (TIGR00297 family)